MSRRDLNEAEWRILKGLLPIERKNRGQGKLPGHATASPGGSGLIRISRAFLADTTALILFFTTTGIVNERFVAGMTWEQVLHARLLGAALMVPVGRPYGVWRDWLMRRAKPDRLSQVAWDSLALVSFQVPIYAAIIAVSGASGRGLFLGTIGAAAMMLVLGRPYGAFLVWIRRLFGLPPSGEAGVGLREAARPHGEGRRPDELDAANYD